MRNILIILFATLALTAQAQMKVVRNITSGVVITSVEAFPVSMCTVYTDNNVTVNTYADEKTANSAINKLSPALFPALPATGKVYAGKMYSYSGTIVQCLQDHDRTIYTPAETPALFAVYRANNDDLTWTENEQVKIGWIRTFEGQKYTCLQSHMTLKGWEPPKTLGVLWSVVAAGAEWKAGVAYKVGDVVTFEGSTYTCLQAHTSISTWQPPVVPALWKKQAK